MFPQLDVVVSPDVPLKDKVTYFANLNIFHGANLDEKQIEGVKAKVLELVESPISRCEGFLLWEAALQQKVTFFFDTWHSYILAALETGNNICQEVALRVVKLILSYSKSTAYLAAVAVHLSELVKRLVTDNKLNCVAVLECLYQCIRSYPKSVIDNEKDIQSFLNKQMDTNSTQVCEVVTNCFCNLPLCVLNSDSKSALTKTFTSTLKNVLYTLQKILNQLVNKDEVDLIDEEDKPIIYQLPDKPDKELSEILMCARIFSSYSICAAKFLCVEDTVLQVPVLWMLKFVHKVFSLTNYLKVCESKDRCDSLKLVYPTILKGAMTILESLVQNFGMIEQTENIITLLREALDASYVATFIGVPNCQMRNITWRILNVWLMKYGTQISIEVGSNSFFLQELFKDIAPPESDAVTSKKQSKYKKIEAHELDETSNYNKTRSSTCIEALKVLHEIVNTASTFLEEKFKEDIANKIFGTCREIQKNMHPMKRFPFPYMNEKIRKKLYKIVIALGSSSDFNIRIMQQAFAVLRVAEKDKSYQVKLLTRRANTIARHMLQPKKKFPEAVTNKKALYESAMEEDVCSGWENITICNVYHSNQENHNADPQIEIADTQIEIAENNASLSSEAHNSMQETEMQNNFPSETEYSSSKFDRLHNSTQSESENESIMEQDIVDDEINEESNSKSFVNVIHTNENIKNDVPTEIDVSSEDENSSVGEEELEDSRVEEEDEEEDEEVEEEEEELSVNKVVVRADQNGLASASEDEEAVANLTKSENGEYSSEEVSCEEEEISREVCNDLKHEIETLEEDERPMKKPRLDEDNTDSIEENEILVKKLQLNNEESLDISQEDNGLTKVAQLTENSVEVTENAESNSKKDVTKDVEDDLNCINEEIVQNSCHPVEESRTSKSPTFDEMCADLVLCESSQLADS